MAGREHVLSASNCLRHWMSRIIVWSITRSLCLVRKAWKDCYRFFLLFSDLCFFCKYSGKRTVHTRIQLFSDMLFVQEQFMSNLTRKEVPLLLLFSALKIRSTRPVILAFFKYKDAAVTKVYGFVLVRWWNLRLSWNYVLLDAIYSPIDSELNWHTIFLVAVFSTISKCFL